MGKRKADCTPEEWELVLADGRAAYQKHREKRIERNKAYNKTDVAIARRRAYDMRPEIKARRQEREKDYGPKYRKQQWLKIKSDPAALRKHYDEVRHYRTGMTPETFEALLVAQGNKCAICERPFGQKVKGGRTSSQRDTPCADHCHNGGGPRGLLCNHCNTVEGHIRKTGLSLTEFNDRMHDYLLNPPIKSLR